MKYTENIHITNTHISAFAIKDFKERYSTYKLHEYRRAYVGKLDEDYHDYGDNPFRELFKKPKRIFKAGELVYIFDSHGFEIKDTASISDEMFKYHYLDEETGYLMHNPVLAIQLDGKLLNYPLSTEIVNDVWWENELILLMKFIVSVERPFAITFPKDNIDVDFIKQLRESIQMICEE